MASDYKDDGRVIADMSEVERQPMLMPRFGRSSDDRSRRSKGSGNPGIAGGSGAADASDPSYRSGSQNEVRLDPEERRAMIRGAVSAGLVAVCAIAAAFALFILLLSGKLGAIF